MYTQNYNTVYYVAYYRLKIIFQVKSTPSGADQCGGVRKGTSSAPPRFCTFSGLEPTVIHGICHILFVLYDINLYVVLL